MTDILVALLLLVGAFLCLSAALGVTRFPDVYSRMHAASKAGTLGVGVLFVAVAVQFSDIDITIRALVGIAFFILTAPISAHLLARAAYWAGVKPWSGTGVDHLAGRYKKDLHRLDGFPFDNQ
ncbi:multicomponent Na+:H+ antiporter subunit G [Rhodoligotrophos appendicifer]|uniref:monovalent cation/H(+) antiporter subunit G n=1 Tax=Rhodoligotrophos appendicifer TaxID=987056 RepID=UPI0011848CBF|nr:monovalent cation/H(+) antiporter subunit G [Rhodoligotrophos appendicifer]